MPRVQLPLSERKRRYNNSVSSSTGTTNSSCNKKMKGNSSASTSKTSVIESTRCGTSAITSASAYLSPLCDTSNKATTAMVSSLNALHSSLMCPICKCVLTSPVATLASCTHSFCYTCIFQHISAKDPSCPKCGICVGAGIKKVLQVNPQLESVVTSYKHIRHLLDGKVLPSHWWLHHLDTNNNKENHASSSYYPSDEEHSIGRFAQKQQLHQHHRQDMNKTQDTFDTALEESAAVTRFEQQSSDEVIQYTENTLGAVLVLNNLKRNHDNDDDDTSQSTYNTAAESVVRLQQEHPNTNQKSNNGILLSQGDDTVTSAVSTPTTWKAILLSEQNQKEEAEKTLLKKKRKRTQSYGRGGSKSAALYSSPFHTDTLNYDTATDGVYISPPNAATRVITTSRSYPSTTSSTSKEQEHHSSAETRKTSNNHATTANPFSTCHTSMQGVEKLSVVLASNITTPSSIKNDDCSASMDNDGNKLDTTTKENANPCIARKEVTASISHTHKKMKHLLTLDTTYNENNLAPIPPSTNSRKTPKQQMDRISSSDTITLTIGDDSSIRVVLPKSNDTHSKSSCLSKEQANKEDDLMTEVQIAANSSSRTKVKKLRLFDTAYNDNSLEPNDIPPITTSRINKTPKQQTDVVRNSTSDSSLTTTLTIGHDTSLSVVPPQAKDNSKSSDKTPKQQTDAVRNSTSDSTPTTSLSVVPPQAKDNSKSSEQQYFCYGLVKEQVRSMKTCARRGMLSLSQVHYADCYMDCELTAEDVTSCNLSLLVPNNDDNGQATPIEIDKTITPFSRLLFSTSSLSSLFTICGFSEMSTCDGDLVRRSFGYILSVAAGLPMVASSWITASATKREWIPIINDNQSNDLKNTNDNTASRGRRNKRSNVMNDDKSFLILGCTNYGWMVPVKAQKARNDRILLGKFGCGLLDGYVFLLCGEFDAMVLPTSKNSKKKEQKSDPPAWNCYSKERVVTLLELCGASVFDLVPEAIKCMGHDGIGNNDDKKELSSAWFQQWYAKKQQIAIIVRKGATAQDVEAAEKYRSWLYSASAALPPIVKVDWLIGSIADFEVKSFTK